MSLLKFKIYSLAPYWGFKNFRARRIVKKAKKDLEKYPISFQWNYVLKRSKKVLKAFNADVEIIGYNNLPKGAALLVSNHQSNLDVVLLIESMRKQSHEEGVQHKKCRFIAKKELKTKKAVQGWMNLTQSIYIDRKNPRDGLKKLTEFGKAIKKDGEYGVIFPEGTRTKDGKIGEFKSGAFRLAKQEFIPIVPVTINHTNKLENLERTGKTKVQINFHKPIKPMTFMSQPTDKIAQRIKRIVEKNYKQFNPTKSGNKIFK